jgi:hypothetical protein
MAQSRARKGAEEQEQPAGVSVQQPAERMRRDSQPWHELAREAAQIVVSALALYASVKAFLNKMKERREA